MIRIGITGGIGCGKSLFASMLKDRGVPVYDCDSDARRLMASESCREALKSATGVDFYANGALDRNQMTDYLFSSPENAAKVNSVVHPLVRQAFREWNEALSVSGFEVCAVESAILLEAGMRDDVDVIVVVDAPDDIRIARVMLRDSVSKEKVVERMNAQMPQAEKLKYADYTVCNDGDVMKLAAETDAVLLAVRGKVSDNV